MVNYASFVGLVVVRVGRQQIAAASLNAERVIYALNVLTA